MVMVHKEWPSENEGEIVVLRSGAPEGEWGWGGAGYL